MNTDHKEHIAIIGAGVTGLQTGVFLIQAGYKVTVLARTMPGDPNPGDLYTSPCAGGQWRTHNTADNPRECQWDIETYNHWKKILEKEEAAKEKGEDVSESGLGIYESLNYWADSTPLTINPDKHLWFLPYVLSPSIIPGTSLPLGVGYGVGYKTFCFNPVPYLKNLQRIFLLSPNAKVIRYTFPTDQGLGHAIRAAQNDDILDLPKVHVWINATGLGSKALVPDEGMYPTRGQTILVKGQAEKAVTWLRKDGGISYVIPRPGGGGTILGGSKQDENWDEKVDGELAKDILGRCREIAPELLDKDGRFEILSHQVGFRPSRKGGPRVESEELEGGIKAVHSYGHAGGGYQSSVGSSRQVVRLVEEIGTLKAPEAKL